MGLFDLFKKKESPKAEAPAVNVSVEKKPKVGETVLGTGMNYHMDNIMSFAEEYPGYDNITKKDMIANNQTKIYKYKFNVNKFYFEEEPDNEYDTNAVKIMADGKLIAYVKKGSAKHIKNLISADNIKSIKGEIGGGDKIVLYDDSMPDEKPHWVFEKGNSSVYVRLEITYKTPRD